MRNSTIDVQRVAGLIGAEIHNVDLSTLSAEQTILEIREALNTHGVIFFRDQKLTPQQYVDFGEKFGELTVSKMVPTIPNFPKIAEIRKEPDQKDNIGGGWHTDQADRQNPIMGTILYAQETPSYGGDTLFANMAAAYDALSDGLKKTLQGLRGVNSYDHLMAQVSKNSAGDRNVLDLSNKPRGASATHPVVLTHPENGRKVLYVNPGYTCQFEGWTQDESKPLLDYLFQHASQPEFQCRFRWSEGSLAFWDNRQTWHYAANDYHGQRRVMHRLMVQQRPAQ